MESLDVDSRAEMRAYWLVRNVPAEDKTAQQEKRTGLLDQWATANGLDPDELRRDLGPA